MPVPKLTARLSASGEAKFTADMPLPARAAYCSFGQAYQTGQVVVNVSTERAAAMPGAAAAVTAIEEAIEGWTAQDALRRGQRCRAQADGVVTAGVPIGTSAFVRTAVEGVLAMHERAHDELEQLCDVQAAYLLLRYSLSVRFVYLLRTIGPVIAELRDLLPRHDARQSTRVQS